MWSGGHEHCCPHRHSHLGGEAGVLMYSLCLLLIRAWDCWGRGARVRWTFVLGNACGAGGAKQFRCGNWSCSGQVLGEGIRLRVGLTGMGVWSGEGWEVEVKV